MSLSHKKTPGTKKGLKLPEVLTGEERILLLRQPNRRAPTGLRNRCLMQVMLDAGLRASEVLKLKVKDLDWMSGKLKVKQGKGKKDRILWLNQQALDLLKKWREKRPHQADGCPTELLFTTLDGKPLSDRYLRAMVERYAKKADLSKDVHPHTLRHTFATDLYRETKNIRLVQKALGHSGLSSTMIYTHIVDEELEEALRGFRAGQVAA